jgi:hypothetical protein
LIEGKPQRKIRPGRDMLLTAWHASLRAYHTACANGPLSLGGRDTPKIFTATSIITLKNATVKKWFAILEVSSRMWGRKRIRGPKIIIALIDFNQTVFRLGDAETETVIFNDFLEFKSKIVFVLSENFGWDGRTDGRTDKSCQKLQQRRRKTVWRLWQLFLPQFQILFLFF